MLTPELNGVTKPRCRKNYNGVLYIRQKSFGKPPWIHSFLFKAFRAFFCNNKHTTNHRACHPKEQYGFQRLYGGFYTIFKRKWFYSVPQEAIFIPLWAETKWE